MSAPAAAAATSLSGLTPLLLSASLRLHHRYDSTQAVEQWLRGAIVKTHASSRGHEGDIVLGWLHGPTAAAGSPPPLRLQDHRGEIHHLQPGQKPLRVLTVLGSRESSSGCCGGVFDAETTTDSGNESGMALTPGMQLAWLGEEGGLVGRLVADAPPHLLLGVRNVNNPSAAPDFEFAAQACTFEVIGLVLDAASGHPLHISTLCPPIPRSLTVDLTSPTTPQQPLPPPAIILVGSTASTCGKTSLVCSLILALHERALAAGQPAPRVAYVKLSGSGGSRDLASVRALKNARGQPAVSNAFDHIDVGLPSTYGQQAHSTERFKHAVTDLLALASAPCALPQVASSMPSSKRPAVAVVGSPASAHTGALLPPDLIVGELGSDLIAASNPVLLSMHALQSRLLALWLITSDALSILGAMGYLHGTLRFPPAKLHLFSAHSKNHVAMLARIRGSDVQLHAHTPGEVAALLQEVFPPQAAHAVNQQHLQPPPPLQQTQQQQQQQQASTPQVQTNGGGGGSATSTPAAAAAPGAAATVPSSATNGSTRGADAHSTPAVASNGAATSVSPKPAVATATAAVVPGAKDVSPETLAANNDALAWVERSFVPVPLPEAPSTQAEKLSSPEQAALWLQIVQWVLQCMQAAAAAGLPVSTPSVAWDSNHVGSLVLKVSRSERLQRSLAMQATQRRRDKARAAHAKEQAEAERIATEDRLSRLAGAKSGAASPSTAAAATTSALPASTQLLLACPDYAHSPWWVAPAPLAPPVAIPAALLTLDAALAALRRVCVPARVHEEVFFDTYFAHVYDELHAYLTRAQA